MTKIAYNDCYGGFSLSAAAVALGSELSGDNTLWSNAGRDIPRTNPFLIQVIEQLGSDANGSHAQLAIAELAPGTKYRIDENDGIEAVMAIDDYDWFTA